MLISHDLGACIHRLISARAARLLACMQLVGMETDVHPAALQGPLFQVCFHDILLQGLHRVLCAGCWMLGAG